MVEADARDDAHFGSDDVGAVQAASQTDLDDGQVDILVRKPAESHPRGDLEERKVQLVESPIPACDEVPHFFFADHPRRTVGAGVNDAHALPEIQDMGRGIEPDLETGGGQRGSQHVGHGPLAVGPCDVDGSELPVGLPEQGSESLHVLQSWFVGISESRLLHGRETHEQFFEFALILYFVHVDFLELNSNLAIFTT